MSCYLIVLIYAGQHLIIMISMFFKAPTTTNTVLPVSTIHMEQKKMPFKEKQPMAEQLQGTNLLEEHYKWTLQQPVEDSDNTVAMVLHLSPVPNQKKRFLDFEAFTTYLLNYGGTDFPTGISLCITQLSGFMNEQGMASSVVANSFPFQIGTVLNAGGIIGYNVVYKLDGGIIWDITGINTLTFKIKLFGDTTYRTLPSAQPLEIIAKITRVIF